MQALVHERKKELIVAIAISLLLIVIGVFKSSPKSTPAPAAASSTVSARPAESVSTALAMKAKDVSVRREKGLAAIEEHEALIDSDPRAEDVPDRLVAIGNLYQYQVKDYNSGIEGYRDFIRQFPKHHSVPQAYIEIAQCYEKLDDGIQARYTYQEMVDSLDPSLEHVKYAKLKLGED